MIRHERVCLNCAIVTHPTHISCDTTPLSHISSSLGDVIRHERVCLNCAMIQGRGVMSRRGYGKPSLSLRCDSSCLYQEIPSWISLMNICSYKTQTLLPLPPTLHTVLDVMYRLNETKSMEDNERVSPLTPTPFASPLISHTNSLSNLLTLYT